MQTLHGRSCFRCILLVLILTELVESEKQKRQIFREQVLPALGGKIPEEAFQTDRLALNRLNKEGITVVDGVLLEARNVDKHPTHVRSMPELIQVYATSDGRYVPPEGRYRYNQRKTVDTTYVIRMPVFDNKKNEKIHENSYQKSISYHIQPKVNSYTNFYKIDSYPTVVTVKPQVYKPIIRPLILPATEALIEKSYYQSSWNIPYDWDNSRSNALGDFYYSNAQDFNTHQIIGDYEGFLHDFRDRSSRHISSAGKNHNNNGRESFKNGAAATISPDLISSEGSKTSDSTVLTKIPVTEFSCEGRIGTFADVETKCQVFHECSGWSKTSSLCPVGTAYSEIAKRCEWSNTVNCT